MVLKRAEWPQPDEFAIAVATKVANYGAYVVLPEFGEKEGFIHISEISSTSVRNIRNHIHENQRVVIKVLKVDLAVLSTAPQPDKAVIDAKIKELIELKGQLLGAKYGYIAAQRQVLTPPQQVSFDMDTIHGAMHGGKGKGRHRGKH